jgi:hypothetical protein
VVPQLDPFTPANNEFGTKERLFNFGAVIAQLPDPDARPPSAKSRASATSGTGGWPKSLGHDGKSAEPQPAGTSRAALPAGGAKAALKFTNPGKVPCVVAFSIKPRGALLAGGCGRAARSGRRCMVRRRTTPSLIDSCRSPPGAAHQRLAPTHPPPLPHPPTGQVFPMAVEHAQLVIPSQESRYTQLHFAPTAIQQYSATFEASVQGGADPATRGFSCELRGEGTLPTLSVQVRRPVPVLVPLVSSLSPISGRDCCCLPLVPHPSASSFPLCQVPAPAPAHCSQAGCFAPSERRQAPHSTSAPPRPAPPRPAPQEPSSLDPSGRPVLRFPRLLRGRVASLPLVLRNQGVLPADARLELPPCEAFRLEGGPAHSLHLEPREGASFAFSFAPLQVGSFSAVGSLRVRCNPFESYQLVLQGECYQVGRAAQPVGKGWASGGQAQRPAGCGVLCVACLVSHLAHVSQPGVFVVAAAVLNQQLLDTGPHLARPPDACVQQLHASSVHDAQTRRTNRAPPPLGAPCRRTSHWRTWRQARRATS